MRLEALSLISMAHPGSGVNPIINSFRVKHRGILSVRAHNALSGLGPSGQQNLRQLDSLLSQSSLKDINFGGSNKLLPEIVTLSKNLDASMGISLEPVLLDEKFILITIDEKADFLKDVRQGDLKPEEPSLDISSFTTLKTLGNGYRSLAVLPPAEIEAERVSPEQALAGIEGKQGASKSDRVEQKLDKAMIKYIRQREKLSFEEKLARVGRLSASAARATYLGVGAIGISIAGLFLGYFFGSSLLIMAGAISAGVALLSLSRAIIPLFLLCFSMDGWFPRRFCKKFEKELNKISVNDITGTMTRRSSAEREIILNVLKQINPTKATEVRNRLVESDHSQLRVEASETDRTAPRIYTAEPEAETEVQATAEAEDAEADEAEINKGETRTV